MPWDLIVGTDNADLVELHQMIQNDKFKMVGERGKAKCSYFTFCQYLMDNKTKDKPKLISM